jgi:hypothetical protein
MISNHQQLVKNKLLLTNRTTIAGHFSKTNQATDVSPPVRQEPN